MSLKSLTTKVKQGLRSGTGVLPWRWMRYTTQVGSVVVHRKHSLVEYSLAIENAKPKCVLYKKCVSTSMSKDMLIFNWKIPMF